MQRTASAWNKEVFSRQDIPNGKVRPEHEGRPLALVGGIFPPSRICILSQAAQNAGNFSQPLRLASVMGKERGLAFLENLLQAWCLYIVVMV